jgi:SAM-dependent methyltransferase
MVKDFVSPTEYSDPAAFWTKIGSTYKEVCNEAAVEYQRQIGLLQDYLAPLFNGDHKIKRILEIGPGYGRITKFMLQTFGDKVEAYHAMDISIPMIHSLLKHLNGVITQEKGAKFQIRHFDISEVETVFNYLNTLPYQEEYKYDLILTVECLMHIRPECMKGAIKNITSLLQREGHLINLDFYNAAGVGYALSPENFLHDYPSMYQMYGGLELINVVKLIGQDQCLIHARLLN